MELFILHINFVDVAEFYQTECPII